uniref:Bet v I/Major latex protein domain-containing protein n=1 Tax=Salix viminalis TaxID=40686 RepID=A0A6N2KPY7_SALVM
MAALTFTEEFSSNVEAKRLFTAMVLEGDSLLPRLLPQFEATPEGGCKGTFVSKYFPKQGAEIKEEEIKEGKEKAAALYKVVEDYLVANPQACA